MPTYQYECDGCGHTFDILQSIVDKKLRTCPKCKEDTLYRLVGTGSGIIFKGSGFYETDYKNKSGCPAKEDSGKCAACPASK